MSIYTMKTFADFVQDLNFNHYKTATAARRALSKMKKISAQSTMRGRRLIKKKFPEYRATKIIPTTTGKMITAVYVEYMRAKKLYPNKFNSAHEGYAVILEEVDELWEEVKKKQKLRDKAKMKAECIQIAAMAIQFAMELT